MLREEENTLYRTVPYTILRADTFLTRFKGLMFRRIPLKDEGLLIVPCNSIHMCFMFFSIDVVFLTKNHEIIKVVENLKPWHFVSPIKGAHAVLELPAGSIKDSSIKVGEFIKV
ncbi:DUF192 domain-containing protein [Pseudalkalibacillus hwajinpoensis]|uniref:DUF192 domain-containing protein n=1 Tax=Guptibacillus hwajinpoensis TaxID=208199 RepID=A0A4U1MMG1_9BACL|nr:DUF192 domain-containing protein [Pseudalkalibacillus hwajinpoensis]TKD72137.1 DUF192 domain-containing protein [Pseudalkalibacillus hwajinpoensis]